MKDYIKKKKRRRKKRKKENGYRRKSIIRAGIETGFSYSRPSRCTVWVPPARGGGSTRYRLLIYSCRYPRPRLKSAVLHCTTTSIPYYPYPAFHGIRRCDLPSARLINRRKLNGTFGLNFFHGSKVFSIASSYPFRTFSYLYSRRCINPARSFSSLRRKRRI